MGFCWRRAPLLAGMLGVLAATGCGTSVAVRDTRYAGQLQAIQQRFTAGVNDVLRGMSPDASQATTADAVGRYEATLAGVELRLRAIHATPTVSRLHRHVVQTINRYGAEVRRMIGALRGPSGARLKADELRFRSATAAMSADVQSTFRRIAATLRRDQSAMSP
jgi:hypothetical protein